jgi:hypothetical protein
MQTRVLELAVIYRCKCGQVNRGPVSVYKGQDAKREFMKQFIFEPADRLAEAASALDPANYTDFERSLSKTVRTKNARTNNYDHTRRLVLEGLEQVPRAAEDAQMMADFNWPLDIQPDWEQLRVFITPVVACACKDDQGNVTELRVGATEQLYTCRCPECEAINDWQEPPSNPVTCGSCGQQFHLDFTLLWPGGINAREAEIVNRGPVVGGPAADLQR